MGSSAESKLETKLEARLEARLEAKTQSKDPKYDAKDLKDSKDSVDSKDLKDPEVRAPQIDPESAESFISEKRIGERIKRLRLKKSMGLVELGRHTGLSASFLSQLETGRVVPTLRNLARIAMVFSKDLSYFFETEPHTLFRLHKKKERVRLPQTGADDPNYFFESLGYMVPDRQLDPYYAEFVPLKKTAEVRPHVHPGYEFLYLLDGDLEIRHSDKIYNLEGGDAVYFDASTPHAYRCLGKASANAIIVTMHLQQPQPAMNLRPLGSASGIRTVPALPAKTAPGAIPSSSSNAPIPASLSRPGGLGAPMRNMPAGLGMKS